MTTFNILASLLLSLRVAAADEPKTIKFATLAPEGSSWMKTMNELDAELRQATNGALKFKAYAGGVSGDEKDVIKKIRINQLQAGGFTGVGLGEIAPETRILDAPWLFRSDAEVDYIYKTFEKTLASAIEKGGYVLLGWTELGSVYVFSKNPINAPEDMKRQKMWVWEGDPIAQAAYAALGVNPIALSIVDVMSSLQTGLIDAVYGPPTGVIALQWFTRAKHIYSVPLARAAGAVLISKKFFDGLTAQQRKILLEVGAKHLRRLNEASRKDNAVALESLRKEGLVFSAAPADQTLKLYEALGRSSRRALVGKLYSAELLGEVERSLEKFRAKKN